jgi:hypothetical protein
MLACEKQGEVYRARFADDDVAAVAALHPSKVWLGMMRAVANAF